MALHVVVQTSDRRVVAAFTQSADAATYNTASGAGHATVAVSDAQQGDDDVNSILGKTVSATGVVAAYSRTGNVRRLYRRAQCYDLIAEALNAAPAIAVKEDEAASTVMHKYLRACFAAASLDTNMDNATRFGEVEEMAKGGALEGGMPEFFRLIVVDEPTRTAWATALLDTVRVISVPDSSGGVVAKTAALQNDWHSNAAYHAIRAYARSD